MNRVIIAVGIAAIGASAWLHASQADAFCQMTTEQSVQSGEEECSTGGVPLAWDRRCISYMVDMRASQTLSLAVTEQIVDTSFAAWADVTCDGTPVDFELTPLVSSTCQVAEFNSSGGNVNTVAFLEDWADADGDALDPRAFAITFVWHSPSTGEIFDGDILINEDLGPYAQCPPEGCPAGNPGDADLQNILTHEVGHFFGVGHTNIEDATMFPSAERTDTSKRTLAPDDIDAMCTIYPPGSLPSECNSAPIGGLDANCEDGGAASSKGGCSIGAHRSTDVAWWVLSLGLAAVLVGRFSRRRTTARA